MTGTTSADVVGRTWADIFYLSVSKGHISWTAVSLALIYLFHRSFDVLIALIDECGIESTINYMTEFQERLLFDPYVTLVVSIFFALGLAFLSLMFMIHYRKRVKELAGERNDYKDEIDPGRLSSDPEKSNPPLKELEKLDGEPQREKEE